MFRLLLLIFLIVPIIEIYVLIEVGSYVGALTTVALVVLTALVGATLMRAQGFATLQRVQAEVNAGEVPALTMMEGLLILIAGALLLTPGFVTDAIGFSLLVPPWRRAMVRSFAGNVITAGFSGMRGRPGSGFGGGSVIDGEFTHRGAGFEDGVRGGGERRVDRLDPPR